MPFYTKGDVRIRYRGWLRLPAAGHTGRGFELSVSNWATAVFNAMEEFKNEFHCITMDQRNANGGESTGPVPVNDPWEAFADDQLGLMDHLGIREFFFGLLHRLRLPSSFWNGPRPRRSRRALPAGWDLGPRTRTSCTTVAAIPGPPEFRARRPDVPMETIEAYLHNLYRVQPRLRVQRVATSRVRARRRYW